MPFLTKQESKNTLDWLAEKANRSTSDIKKINNRQLMSAPINPTFLNSWDNAGDPYLPHTYRVFDKEHLFIAGVLTGGDSDTVAYIIDEALRPTKDYGWAGVALDTTLFIVSFQYEASTGEVRIVY